MIVKLQRPISGNMKPMALVYNESHTFEVMLPLTKRILKMMGSDYKQYWEAHMANHRLVFDRQVEDREW